MSEFQMHRVFQEELQIYISFCREVCEVMNPKNEEELKLKKERLKSLEIPYSKWFHSDFHRIINDAFDVMENEKKRKAFRDTLFEDIRRLELCLHGAQHALNCGIFKV